MPDNQRYNITIPTELKEILPSLSIIHDRSNDTYTIEGNLTPTIKERMTSFNNFNDPLEFAKFIKNNLKNFILGKEILPLEDFYTGTTNLKMQLNQKNFICLFLQKFFINLKCNSCKKIHKSLIEGDNTLTCTCGIKITTSYKYKMIDNPMIGYLNIVGGILINFSDLFFQGICQCNRRIKCVNSYEERCECGDVNYLKVDSFEYLVKTDKKEVVSCPHYKDCKRLLIFPCCNTPYFCPICHDKNESHGYSWAYKMICLNCNKKEDIRDVCRCGYVHKKSKQGHFWEGGEGTRNKALLNKKDSKKYKK